MQKLVVYILSVLTLFLYSTLPGHGPATRMPASVVKNMYIMICVITKCPHACRVFVIRFNPAHYQGHVNTLTWVQPIFNLG